MLATGDGAPKVHAHLVLGKRDGTAHGGHLLAAHVRPTLEVMLTEAPAHLRRRFDPDAGLALIDIDARGERVNGALAATADAGRAARCERRSGGDGRKRGRR